eukprot:TRINITY_DN22798_c0_g2_i1.p1 TRINITY_DN22798_c0_g2~~TRINITY_DN22798_c0_g2_i1.p1  ORF type:complete len:469 (+),score=61.69 TRINITY_DN22798_c0_g2_i1:56-1462(+)
MTKSSDVAPDDLLDALRELDLADYLPKFHKPLGVHQLAEINELAVDDFELIGLTRLQMRRLLKKAQSAAGSTLFSDTTGSMPRASGSSTPPIVEASQNRQGRESAEKEEDSSKQVPRHDGQRPRSLSRVSFASASGSDGYEFELDARNAILSWLQGYGEELSAKSLGIHQHDCDLVMRLSWSVPCAKLLPPAFETMLLNRKICKAESLLLFEMKARTRRVEHAVKQLRTRLEKLDATASSCGVHMITILGHTAEEANDREFALQAAQSNPDILIAVVDPAKILTPRRKDAAENAGPAHSSAGVGHDDKRVSTSASDSYNLQWSPDAASAKQERCAKAARAKASQGDACRVSKVRQKATEQYYAHKVRNEDRKTIGDMRYYGRIMFYNAHDGYGFVKPCDEGALPHDVQQSFSESQKNKKRSLYFRSPDVSEGFQPVKGAQVHFQLYVDVQGFGAYNLVGAKQFDWFSK